MSGIWRDLPRLGGSSDVEMKNQRTCRRICVNKGSLTDNDGQYVRTLEKEDPVEWSRYDSPCKLVNWTRVFLCRMTTSYLDIIEITCDGWPDSLGRFVWEKETERLHAHWRYSLHTFVRVRVLDWSSSTQKEFCITLWYSIVDLCWSVSKMMLVEYW